MRFELLNDGQPTGEVILADEAFMAEQYPPGTYRQAVEPPAAEPTEDPRIWWIDVGPFKDRLGMDAPAIAASSHSACRGTMALLDGRKYVDLKDPRVAGMLDVLIATAQPTADPVWPTSGPMTPAKKAAILTTPTTEAERHVKGLP